MANIRLKNVTKNYKNVNALNQINLEIKDKEFFVLFGPAGAGKTTMLKVIAGIELHQMGDVEFDGKNMNLVEPADRNVSMVFENYALYPHMTVYDNIASPMRSPLYKEKEEYIKKEVHRVSSMMGIDHLLDRLPRQCSNGQRQRVALGRALVRKPRVFLMDEPLAHLDAKLKNLMRTELKGMQQEFDATTIYVTHDYLEALSLGDRIGIINEGQLIQIATGDEVYYSPANEFVAKLVGEPEINIFKSEIVKCDDTYKVLLGGELQPVEEDVLKVLLEKDLDYVDVGIRGNNIEFSLEKGDDSFVEGSVYSLEPIGNKSILIVKVEEELIRLIAPNDLQVELDSKIFIKFDMKNAMYFEHKSKEFITRHNIESLIGVSK
ncbi:ATP-binding cassette domain-containing protein [Iocasia frigidifontis]|uniref:ATP-binding cassette domain-containing protein n=1 Tax=Iocasia fonsfrigidae TaxID=2682810 RepID=A0A8A7KCN2_9FIRM|nr:ABC transporter ATP-binding protein [Iocasia fonsfrigidae]QTL99546.1 ATP-binding cassette domain-containing protein [Iocasia fonsfrigidae]